MNRKRFTIQVICIFISSSLFSQIDFSNFRLDTFKLPDLHRKSLILSGGLYGRHTNIDQPGLSSNFNSDQSIFRPSFHLNYDHYVNTQSVQSSSFLDFDQSYGFEKAESILGKTKSNYLRSEERRVGKECRY